jgi:protein-L-isoaspartate(D-aspartate) O-methyltransferase
MEMHRDDQENLPLDTYRHKGMRKKLIESIRRKGISDERVLAAMQVVPRHFFMEKAFEEWAYRDQPFPIGEDQTISQPFTVAYQTELLEIKPREKILEIGTGSGYQASILAELGARVFTVERQEVLFRKAKELLHKMRYHNVRCFLRDGWGGLPEFAPYDKIIVTAGADHIPQSLKAQLAVGGILVIPVGKNAQNMVRIERTTQTEWHEQVLESFRFVPMLHGINKRKNP